MSKNVHDNYNGYFPTKDQRSSKENKKSLHLSEIQIEPLQTADHHQKNFYEKRFQNPAQFKYVTLIIWVAWINKYKIKINTFSLQNKPFDDNYLCQKLGHDCNTHICSK